MTSDVLQQIVTFTGALLSAGLGGFIASRISRGQLRHQMQQSERQRHIENMERLHEALSELANTAKALHVAIVARVTKGVPLDRERFSDISFDRMNMLIDFYVPSLRAEGDHIFRGFNDLFAVGADAQSSQTVDRSAEYQTKAFYAVKFIHEGTESAKKKLAGLMSASRIK